NRYEGYFKGDKRHGKGTLNPVSGGKYVGGWENDLQHGDGTFFFADCSSFKGLLFHVAPQGKNKNSVFIFSSGVRYIGDFEAGCRHCQGSFLYPDGSSYEGQWQDNVQHEGTAWYASGIRYVGQWLYGKSHGEAHAITPRGRDTKGSSMVASATAAVFTSTPMVT
ncbi:unnamed protein product, partial [Ectocarpus sp. 12 AP-2014]